jgi:hypothetical protein
MFRRYLAIGLVILVPSTLAAQRPVHTDSGFSAERLQRIGQFMDRRIAANDISGAVALVAHRGSIVYLEARGLMDLATNKTDGEGHCVLDCVYDQADYGDGHLDVDVRGETHLERSSEPFHSRI